MATGSCLLTLDRGNSTLDACLHPDGAARQRQRFRPDDATGLGEWLGQRPVTAAVGATVVPGGLEAVRSLLAGRGIGLVGVPDEVPVPLELAYDTPETLGIDRLVGAYAGWRLIDGAVLTVDCGSATTVNAVAADGVFLGGAIAPGVDGMRAGLAACAPHLPAAEAETALESPPRTTAMGLAVGVQLGYCGLVERLVEVLRPAVAVGAPVLLTGGWAGLYRRHGRLAVEVVDDLVHQGLAFLHRDQACAG